MRILDQINGIGGMAGYLGNSNTKVVHDLSHQTKNRQIGEIEAAGHARMFPPLEMAYAYGYDNCQFCIKQPK
jgi:hypothetical protein